jgi:hypothetical protein
MSCISFHLPYAFITLSQVVSTFFFSKFKVGDCFFFFINNGDCFITKNEKQKQIQGVEVALISL